MIPGVRHTPVYPPAFGTKNTQAQASTTKNGTPTHCSNRLAPDAFIAYARQVAAEHPERLTIRTGKLVGLPVTLIHNQQSGFELLVYEKDPYPITRRTVASVLGIPIPELPGNIFR